MNYRDILGFPKKQLKKKLTDDKIRLTVTGLLKEEFGDLQEAKETGIDVAKRIVKNHQHEKGVDVQTANLILKIYHAYDGNKNLQKKLEKLPLKKLAQGVWRFVK